MNKKTLQITTAALFAAITFIFTYYIHVPIPGGSGGYIHLGDSIIFLAASLLPTPVAVLSGAIGASLADALTPGAAAWAPFTLVIKALMALCFTNKKATILSTRNVIMSILAGLIMVGGYFIAQIVLYGGGAVNVKASLASIPFNFIQLVGSAIVYIVIGYFFDKNSVKKRLVK
ncbi:MAG: hypothetical protein K0R71_1051 [Bacillales bacterium]|jgi:uncharacterized repeat protein (TIGR04002 family)|nr:hypothetical protein [Bacillales bacterium]